MTDTASTRRAGASPSVPQGLLLSEDFASAPVARGWTLETPANQPAATWTGATARSGLSYISASDGGWASPAFPVEPFQYYQLTFRSKAAGKTYWVAEFLDKSGQKLAVDHYSCFEASTDWTENVFCFRARHDGVKAYVAFRVIGGKPFCVSSVAIRPVPRLEVARWADTVYAGMPPVPYAPPPIRWAHLPATMARLRQGKPLKIVMLGDSIVNDTANSTFETLVDRMYPGAVSDLVTSIRGSTGCGFYQHDDALRHFVLDYRPDLVMIGGISNTDAESVRTVIRKIRQQSAAEMFIMTPPVGRVNPFKYPDWKPGVSLDGTDYKSTLFRVATEERVEFLDMESLWGRYIQQAGKPWEYFTRDELHASEQGRQVIARILEAYFTPGSP